MHGGPRRKAERELLTFSRLVSTRRLNIPLIDYKKRLISSVGEPHRPEASQLQNSSIKNCNSLNMSGMASQMLRNSKLESENVSLRASKASLRATNDNLLNDMLKDNLTLISYQDPAGSRDSSDEASCSCPCKTNHVKEAMARVLALSDTLQRQVIYHDRYQ